MNQEQIIRGLQLSTINSPTSDVQLHPPLKVNAVFISDVHLGFKGSSAKELVAFLGHIDPKCVYLVGDFIDGWSLGITRAQQIGRLFHTKASRVEMRLPQGHADVMQKMLRLARNGAYLFYIPGNHDEILRQGLARMPDLPESAIDGQLTFAENAQALTTRPPAQLPAIFNDIAQLGRISVVPQIVHKTADNKRFMVMHGDEFDMIMKNWRFVGIFGTKLRDHLFGLSEWLSRNDKLWLFRVVARRLFGLKPQFSLADHVREFKSNSDMVLPALATAYVQSRNETIKQRRASQPEWKNEPLYDGFIGGHSHIAAREKMNGVDYFNCGDWVGQCTAVVEYSDGSMGLVRWDEKKGVVPFIPPGVKPPPAAPKPAPAKPRPALKWFAKKTAATL